MTVGVRATLLALSLSACGRQRGCLADGLAGRHPPADEDPLGAAFATSGIDCEGGLLRCVGGRVEVSAPAYVPRDCKERDPERRSCSCPWSPALACAHGCVLEGALAALMPGGDAAQLCRAAEPVVRPALPSDPRQGEICAEEGVACLEGLVRSCPSAGVPAHALGFCIHGCAPGISLDPGEPTIGDGAAAILCLREHAERE